MGYLGLDPGYGWCKTAALNIKPLQHMKIHDDSKKGPCIFYGRHIHILFKLNTAEVAWVGVSLQRARSAKRLLPIYPTTLTTPICVRCAYSYG